MQNAARATRNGWFMQHTSTIKASAAVSHFRKLEGPLIYFSRTSADSAGGFEFLRHVDDRERTTETHTVLGQQSTTRTHATGSLDESGSVRECTYD